jgi:hypothetical protein
MRLFWGHGPAGARRLALVGGLILATGCSSAIAQDQETWRCNAPNGHYDEHVLSIPANATSVSGKIAFHSGDFGTEWTPLARIRFTQSDTADGNCHCSGIAAYGYQNPDHVEYDVTTKNEDVAIAQSLFEKSIMFKISIDPQGVMTVAIGKTDPTIRTTKLLYPGHDSVVLSCSGADVSFLNIDVQ